MLQNDLPLSGLRVVEIFQGDLESAGRYLVELGADVVKVEDVRSCRSRHAGVLHDGVNLTFEARNAGKRSADLDLESGAGIEALLRILSWAEVLLIDATQEQASRWTLTERELTSRFPHLVVFNVSGYGLLGPKADWASTIDVLTASASNLSRSGLPEIPEPLIPPSFVAVESVALELVWMVMLAVTQARLNGAGDFIDFSVQDALVHAYDPGFGIGGSARSGEPMKNLPPGRPDTRHLYPTIRVLDGHVRICVLSTRQWRGMVEWLGRPEELMDPALNTLVLRQERAKEIAEIYAAHFAVLTREEAVQQGAKFGVPTASVMLVSEVVTEPAYWESGSFRRIETAAGGSVVLPSPILELDGARPPGGTAPSLGEHTAEIMAELDGVRPQRSVKTPRNAEAGLPFEGLTVLDLGVIVVGAEVGRLFGDYGADVIKIESRDFPDGTRQTYNGACISEGFAWGHRNKQSLGLNLRTPEGMALFKGLAAEADVVLTNFKPGTLEKLGIDYATLAVLNPRIIVSESSAFGRRGPWSGRMGYGPLVRAASGLSELWQYPDVPSSYSDTMTIFPDHAASRLHAAAVAAMLLRRERTGRGGHLSGAQVDIVFSAMADSLALESVEPGSICSVGNCGAIDAPQGVFQAAGDDEWVVIEVRNDEQFRRVARLTDRPDWVDADRYATASSRLRHRSELDATLAEWVKSRTSSQVELELQALGVPASRMTRVADLLKDEHMKARGVFATMHHPQFDAPLETLANEALGRNVPTPRLGPAPLMGEHTRKIALERMRLSEGRIAELLESSVLQEYAEVLLQQTQASS